jgi:release factor glutamine methyltransferase
VGVTVAVAASGASWGAVGDTEALVEAALELAPQARRVLDLGTGTGCLLLAVLSELPAARGIGLDLNPEAAALARRNAQALGLPARFLAGDWADALDASFDLILSNPPYIEAAAIPALMPEVAGHEPPAALDGGADGLDAYRRIIAALPRLLAPGGLWLFETFADGNARYGRPSSPAFLLRPGELVRAAGRAGLHLLAYEDGFLPAPRLARAGDGACGRGERVTTQIESSRASVVSRSRGIAKSGPCSSAKSRRGGQNPSTTRRCFRLRFADA